MFGVLTGRWQKPTRSGNNGQCVEARRLAHVVEVRNSNDPSGPSVTFTVDEWRTFRDAVRIDNEFAV